MDAVTTAIVAQKLNESAKRDGGIKPGVIEANPGNEPIEQTATRLCRLMCGSALRFRPAFIMNSGLRPNNWA